MEEILRKHIERIVGLTDEEFAFVVKHFALKKFRKNEFLIQPGENVRYFYFVISGLLKLGYPDDLGKSTLFLLPWRIGGKLISRRCSIRKQKQP